MVGFQVHYRTHLIAFVVWLCSVSLIFFVPVGISGGLGVKFAYLVVFAILYPPISIIAAWLDGGKVDPHKNADLK
jgi:hypothetical protein